MLEGQTENISVWTTPILILRISLTIIALLGFSLYLWYLKSSDDQSQSRLLNILNGYLSLTGIGFSLIQLKFILKPEQYESYSFLIIGRIAVVHVIAVATIFLLISWATILNHFKPGLYLDISVSWSNKIAIPSLILAFIFTEQALNFSCPKKYYKCEVFRLRTMVMIPATLTSFICQLLVIIDDIWSWRKIFNRLRGLCGQNIVTPANVTEQQLSIGLYQNLVSLGAPHERAQERAKKRKPFFWRWRCSAMGNTKYVYFYRS